MKNRSALKRITSIGAYIRDIAMRKREEETGHQRLREYQDQVGYIMSSNSTGTWAYGEDASFLVVVSVFPM